MNTIENEENTNQKRQSSDYIRVKAAYAKMKTAQMLSQPVYIYGITGYGKTEMVNHFLRKSRYTHYSCKTKHLRAVQECKDEHIIVIDDLQFLRDEEDRKRAMELLEEEHWVILISRSPIPAWLKPSYIKNPFITIDERDLSWTSEDTVKYLSRQEIELFPEQMEDIAGICKGNPMLIRTIAHIIRQTGIYSEDTLEQVRIDIGDSVNHELIEEWDAPIVNFLSYMSFFESFNVPLAELVTGDPDSYRLLEEAKELGNFIYALGEETYSILKILRLSLMRRAKQMWGLEKCNRIYYNAGLYFESKGEEVTALSFYEKSGNKDRIIELLTRNARKNPGNGHFYELRKYYLALPEKTIEKDAVLISGMSMLYSLLLEPEQSEYWYEKLKIYERKQTGSLRREAKGYIAYLDIALPHRGITGIMDILRNIPKMLFDKGVSLPEFSVTSNQPAIMNGGKDFSEWSRHDRELMAAFGTGISLALGKCGKGLVNIALGECLYEKAGDTYEILSLLSKGSLEAQMGGKLELEFAAVGTQVRLNLFHGNSEAAKNILNSFAKRIEVEESDGIGKIIEAMRCRIALYESDTKGIQEWMKKAPDERKEFFIMERYQYLTQIRCYLFLGDYLSAIYLIEKMDSYVKLYQRTMIQIELLLLKAIALYRQKNDVWKETLLASIHLTQDYQFYRTLSEEGAPLLELLQDASFQKAIGQGNLYIEKLLKETKQMALHFPTYLYQGASTPPELSEKAIRILRLQSEGYSYGDISKELRIKETTVKYHCGETYKKLGVTGKADAIMAARDLKII